MFLMVVRKSRRVLHIVKRPWNVHSCGVQHDGFGLFTTLWLIALLGLKNHPNTERVNK